MPNAETTDRLPQRNRCGGFSLLELTVVMIIVTLLVSGVLVGVSLVKQAQLRGVIVEVSRFDKSIQMFLDKYGQLPGDFNKAEEFWGTDPGGCPAAAYNTTPKKETCNGNGDGTIGSCCYGNGYEWFRAWQHLADAEMVEGNFSGTGGFDAANQMIGPGVPASAYTGGGYTLMFGYNNVLTAEDFPYYAMHMLQLGSVSPACVDGAAVENCLTSGKLLKPEEAAGIDIKMDDGQPGTGSVMARPSTSLLNPGCADSTSAAGAKYNTATTAAACGLMFNTGY